MGKRPYLPEQGFLLPPSLREWLPENHLVYFVSDVVDHLNLTALDAMYGEEPRGQPPYDPRMMTKVLVYGYCVGVFSSRRIERRLIEDVGFRVLAAGNAPNFRTIADFCKLHLATLAGLFEEVLKIALEAGALKLGRVALDGTKVQANTAQGDELWPDAGAGTATARRGPGTTGPSRGGGRRGRRALRSRSAGRRVARRVAAARDPAEEDSGGATGAGGAGAAVGGEGRQAARGSATRYCHRTIEIRRPDYPRCGASMHKKCNVTDACLSGCAV